MAAHARMNVPRSWGFVTPVQRDDVLAAQADLLRPVRAVRSQPAPPVRCIAVVSLLLTDGIGPMFAPRGGMLAEIAFQAEAD